MEWEKGAEAFAILACYLILTIPIASASTVQIYSGETIVSTFSFNPWSSVTRDVTVSGPWSDPMVALRFTNSSSSVSVETVFLYKCGLHSPSGCVGTVQGGEFPGGLETEVAWESIADQAVSYPQRGNLLVMSRVNDAGRVFWVSQWVEMTRLSEQEFIVTPLNGEDVDIFVSDISMASAVRDFVTSRRMIPFNPDWVSSIMIASESMFKLAFSSGGQISGTQTASNVLSSISSEFTAVMGPGRDPVIIYDSPSWVCGDGNCQTGLGETEANCCLDCPCSTGGYYCDSTGHCRSEAGVGLQIYGSMDSVVNNCYESHILIAPLEVVNGPNGFDLESAWFSLRGQQYDTTCTRVTTSLFQCQVIVPVMPDCTEGIFSLGPNSVGMSISFMDGSVGKSMDLETSLPTITIGSFTCGQGGCQADLGEDWENCCYECGCPSGFCDFVSGADPSTASCRQDLAEADLMGITMEPRYFSGLEGTETVIIEMEIRDPPESLGLSGSVCSMTCSAGEVPCTASCISSCTLGQDGKLSCGLSFTVDGYDILNDYTLSPEIDFTFTYRNGTQSVVRPLKGYLSQISVGSLWCGDKTCSGEETTASCCYDCGCAQGEYCYTRNTAGPTMGDSCRPESETLLTIDSVGSTSIVDSSIPHNIEVRGHVASPPAGLAMSGVCEIGYDPNIDCQVSCEGLDYSDQGYDIMCNVRVPAIDYITEGQPYYNPNTRMITISPNEFTITLAYNDGYDKSVVDYQRNLEAISLQVTSRCGEDGCQADLGEDATTCCRDCGCSDLGNALVCFQGKSPNGECVSNETILLNVSGFKPDPIQCTIGRIDGPCVFVKTMEAHTQVMNQPHDAVIKSSFFTVGGKSEVMECIGITGKVGKYSCMFTPEDMGGTAGTETREMEFGVVLEYTLGGATVLHNLSAKKEVTISRVKSSALTTCESDIDKLKERQSKADDRADKYEKWGKILALIAVALTILALVCMVCSCNPYGVACGSTSTGGGGETKPPEWVSGIEPSGKPEGSTLSLGACGAGCIQMIMMASQAAMMANQMQMMANKQLETIKQLDSQIATKKLMCSSESFERLSNSMGSMLPLLI